jgi:hypothetical protein
MRWPCRGDTGKLISPCSDGATCSRSFLRFDHEKRHHDKQQECGDQSIFERHRAYPSRKHSWARRCAAPALAGCAHAVSGHVAAVHIGSFLRRGNPDPRMSLVGHNPRLPQRNIGDRFTSLSGPHWGLMVSVRSLAGRHATPARRLVEEPSRRWRWGHIRSHRCHDLLVYCICGCCYHSATLNVDWCR